MDQMVEIKSWSLPAVRVMLNKMGYDLVGTINVTVTDTPYPYDRLALYAKPRSEDQPHVAILLGDIGWDPEGYDACIDYKIFEVGKNQPETLEYWSVGTMNLYWSWSDRFAYNKESFGDYSIKPDTVEWQPMMTSDKYGRPVQVK